MKPLMNITLAALTTLTLNSTVFAQLYGFDDIQRQDARAQKKAFIQNRLAMNDPVLLRKMLEELNEQDNPKVSFTGEGQKLGGDKYINKLLGINHRIGKYLARLAKKQARAAKKALHYRTKPKAQRIKTY